MNDGSRPHRFPKIDPDMGGDILGWECQACGKWISELRPTASDCPIDWRQHQDHPPKRRRRSTLATDAPPSPPARTIPPYPMP